MPAYFHVPSQKVVEVEHQYSGVWYYLAEDGKTSKEDFPVNFREIAGDYVQVLDPPVGVLPSATTPASSPRLITQVDGKDAGLEFNLNKAQNKTSIAQGVVGIGKVHALTILNNRPPEGYRNWQHLAEINQDLPVNWVEIEKDNPHIVF